MTDPENLMTPETEAAVAASPAAAVFDAKSGIVPASAFDPVQRTMQTMLELATKGDPQSLAGLERLEGVLVRAQERQAADEFAAALARFQAKCPPIPRELAITDKGGKVRNRYANLDIMLPIVTPAAASEGISFRFTALEAPPGYVQWRCVVRKGLHTESSDSSLYPTASSLPGLGEQQKVGSGSSYAKKECLVGALGFSYGDPDSDDMSGEPAVPATEQQLSLMRIEIDRAQIDENRVVAYFSKVFKRELLELEDMTQHEAERGLKWLAKQQAEAAP